MTPLIQRAEAKPCHAFDEVYAEEKIESVASTNETSGEYGGAASSSNSEPATSGIENPPDSDDTKQKSSLTLLQWISSTENQKSLRRMAENCTRELDMFDKKVMNDLRTDIQNTIDCARRVSFSWFSTFLSYKLISRPIK